MIEKYFIVTSTSVELRINRVRINRSRPVTKLFASRFLLKVYSHGKTTTMTVIDASITYVRVR